MEEQRIKRVFKDFSKLRALIIGDIMIDSYYWGTVNRISPEAPVPVVSVSHREHRLGGAANVALNVQALGAKPVLCSVTGDDAENEILESLLSDRNLSKEGIIKSKERVTTIKTRVIGNHHQMIRVDSEIESNISKKLSDKLYDRIESIVKEDGIDVIIFEDYDKGVITKNLIKRVVQLAKENKIPITADPKKRHFMDYKELTLFKPNLKELTEGLNRDIDSDNLEDLKKAVHEFHAIAGNEMTFVTLSEKGVYIKTNDISKYIEAHVRDIADVSGAGDTVISVSSLCLALGQSPEFIAALSNLAGGIVCERAGVVPIDKNQLLSEALQLIPS